MRVARYSVFLTIAVLLLNSTISFAVSWEDEKRSWEEQAKSPLFRDPGYAARLAFSPFPIDLGHFYVGEIKKGVWTTVGEIVSAAAIVMTALDASGRSKRGADPVWTTASAAGMALGLSGLLGLKIWSSFDAAECAEKFTLKKSAAAGRQSYRLGIGLSAAF